MKIPTCLLLALALAPAGWSARAADYPSSWIDPDTGHRIVQLSREPGTQSLYFTQYSFTKDGRLVVQTPRAVETIDVDTGAVDVIARQPPLPGPDAPPAERFAAFRGRLHVIEVGRKTGDIYCQEGDGIYAIGPATKVSRRVATLPQDKGGWASINTVNCDETMVAGSITLDEHRRSPGAYPARRRAPGQRGYEGGDNLPGKGEMMVRRLAERLPTILFTLNLQTGQYHQLLRTTDWIDHFQFSPADPTLLLFAHEGPWHEVDRIWLMRTDGTMAPKLIQDRTMKMEIAGHEFWGDHGRWIWYDLQTPRSVVFWLAGYNVATGRRIWYHVGRNQWSVHYNVSPDGKLFCGDGGSETKDVAHAKNGKWLYLFRPKLVPDLGPAPEKGPLIQIGTFDYERLVNLKQHDYVLEPNGMFTPDGKWIIFRSNMNGSVQTYAVEVAKSEWAKSKP
jgi:oligogalacturonide lyase